MRRALYTVVCLLGLIGCSRDPNVVKKRYLESGNKYFDRGKYKEAVIMYKDALQKDQRYGEAHYKLALTYLKLNQASAVVSELRKAVELLPKNDPHHWDAMVKLSELYIALLSKDKQAMEEVQGYIKDLLTRDPNSYDGHRLQGDYFFADAFHDFATARREEGQQLVAAALAEYQKANAVKPNQKEVQMQLARVYWAQGKLADAEALYWQVIGGDKNYQIAYEELYKVQLLENKLPEAEKTLQLAFQNNPKQFRFLVELARYYSLIKQRDKMIGVLNQIKSRSKEYPDAYVRVGDFYYRLGEADSAIKEYRDGIAHDPKQKAEYEKRIILVLMSSGKKTEANEINKQILKDDPNDNDAKQLEATFMLDKGDISKAMAELQSVVSRAPENPVAHFNLARAHLARGEVEQARQQLEKAIELRPDYTQARIKMAQIQISRAEWDGAMKSAGQILAVDRNNLSALLIQSGALMGEKKYDESRAMLANIQKAFPNSSEVLIELGELNILEKKYPEAEDVFRRAWVLNPNDTRGLIGLIQTYNSEHKGDEAVDLLQKESAKQPNRIDLRVLLGSAAVQAGKYDIAIPVYQGVLDSMDSKTKARGDIYMRLGEAYRKKGDLNNALAATQKARDVLPDNPVVLNTLGQILDVAGRYTEAKQVYEATLKIRPDDALTLNNDAYLIAEHGGDLDQALTMATRAKQLLPDYSEVADTLGWIYLKKNLSQQAVSIFQELVQKQPAASTYRYHLAMALYQMGDKPNALKELREALKHSPSAVERQKIQDMIAKVS